MRLEPQVLSHLKLEIIRVAFHSAKSRVAELGDGQNTHLICVRLLYDFCLVGGGGFGFPVFFPLFCCPVVTYVFLCCFLLGVKFPGPFLAGNLLN